MDEGGTGLQGWDGSLMEERKRNWGANRLFDYYMTTVFCVNRDTRSQENTTDNRRQLIKYYTSGEWTKEWRWKNERNVLRNKRRGYVKRGKGGRRKNDNWWNWVYLLAQPARHPHNKCASSIANPARWSFVFCLSTFTISRRRTPLRNVQWPPSVVATQLTVSETARLPQSVVSMAHNTGGRN
jgi:hypothetical protein